MKEFLIYDKMDNGEVVKRIGLQVENHLKEGMCPDCRNKISGIF